MYYPSFKPDDLALKFMSNKSDYATALNAGIYSGKPVIAHTKLSTVTPSYFSSWLSLFRTTLEETAATLEVVMYIMSRAERIAGTLCMAMFPDALGNEYVPCENR